MGHGQKNANRGAAINQNAARIQALAAKSAEFKKDLTDAIEALGERVDGIEKNVAALLDFRTSADIRMEKLAERIEECERLLARGPLTKIKERLTRKGD